ncbi:MAG: DUF47 family protein [Nitrososphaerota archaeon]|nr:DUF47 family protein [Nitrososphaerota archaeon]
MSYYFDLPATSIDEQGIFDLKLNFRRITGALSVGEKRIFSEISQMLDLAQTADSIVLAMLKDPNGDKIVAQNSEIRILEKKGDERSFALAEEIGCGAISSNILENLTQCVNLADNILDNFHNASREIQRMKEAHFGETSNNLGEFYAEFVKLAELGLAAIRKLQDQLKASNPTSIIDYRKEIEIIEEEGDNIKDAIIDKLYKAAPQINYLQFRHVDELSHKFDDILDNCEDLSDEVVSIVNSISK